MDSYYDGPLSDYAKSQGHSRGPKPIEDMNIDEVAHECYERAEANGWHEDYSAAVFAGYVNEWVGNKLMLVVSELTEAQDELRAGHGPADVYYGENGKPEGFAVEMADALIRIFDLLGVLGLDQTVAERVSEKLDFNDSRGKRHGGKAF